MSVLWSRVHLSGWTFFLMGLYLCCQPDLVRGKFISVMRILIHVLRCYYYYYYYYYYHYCYIVILSIILLFYRLYVIYIFNLFFFNSFKLSSILIIVPKNVFLA